MNINITTTAFLLWSLTGFPIQSPEQSGDAGRLVQQLGEFPAALPSTVRSDGSPDPIEERRRAVYGELRALGQDAMPALVRGLSDPNVQVRRNVALFLNVVIGAWSELSHPELDIEPALPALVVAVGDADARVRQLAAQAIGTLGPRAVTAVPALVQLLTDSDVGSRNSACIGLRGIGPAASGALPALRAALSDADADVRRFARHAIESIALTRKPGDSPPSSTGCFGWRR